MECLIAKIRVLLLNKLEIRLFNQVAFALPHLSLLQKVSRAEVDSGVHFDRDDVVLIRSSHSPSLSHLIFFLHVECRQLDWQINSVTQTRYAVLLSPRYLVLRDSHSNMT